MNDMRNALASINGGHQRDACPRNLVRVARNPDDAQIRLWRKVLDCATARSVSVIRPSCRKPKTRDKAMSVCRRGRTGE